ncbi:MAG: hypothetical protein WBA68_01640 [Alteraurantiacibacter sp.]
MALEAGAFFAANLGAATLAAGFFFAGDFLAEAFFEAAAFTGTAFFAACFAFGAVSLLAGASTLSEAASALGDTADLPLAGLAGDAVAKVFPALSFFRVALVSAICPRFRGRPIATSCCSAQYMMLQSRSQGLLCSAQ